MNRREEVHRGKDRKERSGLQYVLSKAGRQEQDRTVQYSIAVRCSVM